MTEREEFEAIFPMPLNCEWTGKGYSATSYNAWETHTFIARFEGWKAARRTTPDREAIIDQILAKLDPMIKSGIIDEPYHSERNGLIMAWNVVASFKTTSNGEKK